MCGLAPVVETLDGRRQLKPFDPPCCLAALQSRSCVGEGRRKRSRRIDAAPERNEAPSETRFDIGGARLRNAAGARGFEQRVLERRARVKEQRPLQRTETQQQHDRCGEQRLHERTGTLSASVAGLHE